MCVYFKHEVCVTERTVNSQLDISDIELQTSAGLQSLLHVTALQSVPVRFIHPWTHTHILSQEWLLIARSKVHTEGQ